VPAFRYALVHQLHQSPSQPFEIRQTRKNGAVLDVTVQVAPLKGEDGDFWALLLVIADAPQRLVEEDYLRLIHEQNKNAVEGPCVGRQRIVGVREASGKGPLSLA